MQPELKDVAEHMKDLGLGALTHAMRLSLYADPQNPSWADLSVLNGAHAAEILIKAHIAVEHPLLIFEELPRSTQVEGPLLKFEDLFAKGRTIDFFDLPERLWATTGQSLKNLDVYKEFGKLRNAIQHFAASGADPSQKTLEFVFKVLDPFIFENWGLYAIDYNEENGDHFEHILDSLVARDIRPRLSPMAAGAWSVESIGADVNMPHGYAAWFEKALKEARRK